MASRRTRAEWRALFDAVLPQPVADLIADSIYEELVGETESPDSVLDKDLTAPPVDSQSGDRYIVAGVATGDWAGHENAIAENVNAVWQFVTPNTGTRVYVDDENRTYEFDGSAWAAAGAAAATIHSPVQDETELAALTDYEDKMSILVEDLGTFRFDTASTESPDTGNVVRPDNITGGNPGRWIRFTEDIYEVAPSRMFLVDSINGDDTTGDGKFSNPYQSIQAAVDHIETNLSPSASNPCAALLMPGVWDETVIIKDSGVGLIGLGGQGACRVRPTTGPSLVLTNATSASLATWLAAGVANYDSGYATLVNDPAVNGGTGPWDNQFRDIDFAPVTNTDYPVVIAGTGAGTSFGGNELHLMRCTGRNGNGSRAMYARLANYVVVQAGDWLQGELRAQNVAGCWVNDCEIGNYHGSYNTGADEPADGGYYGLCGGKSVVRGNVVLDGSARAGYDKLWGGVIEGDVDLDDTAAFRYKEGIIEGNVNAEGGASFLAEGTHIQGNVSFASGAGTAQLDGGSYQGARTDPDFKFVHNINDSEILSEIISLTSGAATQTILSVPLEDERVYKVKLEVEARKVPAGSARAAYEQTALVYREGGGATLGPASPQDDFRDDTPGWYPSGADDMLDVTGNNVIAQIEPGADTVNCNVKMSLRRVY